MRNIANMSIWKKEDVRKAVEHDLRSTPIEDGSVDEYSRSISRERGRKHSAKSLDELAEKFVKKYLSVPYSDEDGNWIEPQDIVNMPIFVNYGVNRLADKVEPKGEKKVYGKLNAFDKAIENRLDFDQLFTWLRNREDLENQIKVSTQSDFYDKGLECVKKAMFAMLDGFSKSIRIERKTMTLEIEKNGSVMDFNCLSDGEKCTMALFGDIARRLVIANPSLDNPLEGTGVVSIDEIDLHMHSSWQRKILGCLREIFPNLQFLITTHSVQVLGEAGDDYKQFLVIFYFSYSCKYYVKITVLHSRGGLFVKKSEHCYDEWDENAVAVQDRFGQYRGIR